MIMTGTNRGAMRKKLSTALPGNSPLTRPKAAMVPRDVAKIIVAKATLKLVKTDSIHGRLFKKFRYWSSEYVLGGELGNVG